MTKLTKTYHADVYMPSGLEQPPAGLRLAYTAHAVREADKDHVEPTLLPTSLPAAFRVIEVETFAGVALKWVVRLPFGTLSGRPRDLVLVLQQGGMVITLWTNWLDDQHMTLARERYEQKP